MQKQTRAGSVSHIQLVVLLWVSGVVTLFGFVLAHDNSYRLVDRCPDDLSVASDIDEESLRELSIGDWQLELYIHPECPCTRISLKLIDQLWSELPARPKLTIYIASYSRLATPWNESSNFLLASRLGQATILEDREAVRAKQNGATASSTLLVTDSNGQRLFIGGISSSRSCDDPNSSYFAVRELLVNRHRIAPASPIYGCDL